jgi:hypothetical protein
VSADIPHLSDERQEIAGNIAALETSGVVDETPEGRLAGIDTDTYLVYREMHALLTGQVSVINRAVYEQRLQDLAALLGDLHRRGEQAYADIMIFLRHRGVA